MDELWVAHLGEVEYREALDLQERLRAARQEEVVPDTMLVLSHPAVYTRGRRTAPGELPFGADWYAQRGIDVVDVNRGGKVTFHNPGQLVAYPIMRTASARDFVRTMEEAIVAALADEGIAARTRADEGPAFMGVWIEDRKIASVGVHVARGVTLHGLAVNVDNDLTPFRWIVPCGLEGVRMTSVAEERGAPGCSMDCFRKRLAHRFAEAHGKRQRLVSRARVEAAIDAVVSVA